MFPWPKSQPPTISLGRQFADLKPSGFEFQKHYPAWAHKNAQPLPIPSGAPPYRLNLQDIIPVAFYSDMIRDKAFVFHTAGDSGGIEYPVPQSNVVALMVKDLGEKRPGRHPARFMYHLGDVVYYNGTADQYYQQFYNPYEDYNAPIFSIPGNHDANPLKPLGSGGGIGVWMNNFCSKVPQKLPEAEDTLRDAMTQPNCYWTLLTPFATIIGLYTNVIEGGYIDDGQKIWLKTELLNASKDKAVIVACHHPPYSMSQAHLGSHYMQEVLDDAFNASGVCPSLVLSGHVHSYQRFNRMFQGGDVPYIVCGTGGYWKLHDLPLMYGLPLPKPYHPPASDISLENYSTKNHGVLRVTVTPSKIFGEYVIVPKPHETGKPKLADAFTLDWKLNKLVR